MTAWWQEGLVVREISKSGRTTPRRTWVTLEEAIAAHRAAITSCQHSPCRSHGRGSRAVYSSVLILTPPPCPFAHFVTVLVRLFSTSVPFACPLNSPNSHPSWQCHSAKARNWVGSMVLLSSYTLSSFVRIKLHFRDSKGQLIKTVEANEGDDILSIAHEHDIDLEGTILSRLAL